MSLQFEIGLDAVGSYRRLNYTPWHAIAEFVDNSTQAYFDNRELLDKTFKREGDKLEVSVVYDRDENLLRISDNSIGMDEETLERALHVAKKPPNPTGRSRYGMGMKTAACWLGDIWTIKTKKLGDTKERFVKIEVDKIAQGIPDLEQSTREDVDENKHYTIIEITNLRKKFQGRTISKIKDFLRSMYRQDLRDDSLRLLWRGEELSWEELDERLLVAHDGSIYKRDFIFEIDEKVIDGWVGVLSSGSRANAGFSIMHSKRVIKGWPDAWRPATIYGQFQGSNDLINQRLVGEINLDFFEVSHTKDDINWNGDEEEIVEEKLAEACKDYRDVARQYRKKDDGQAGPTDVETQTAVDELLQELQSPEMVDAISLEVTPDPPDVTETFKTVIDEEKKRDETFRTQLGDILVKVFISPDRSVNDPYFVCDATQRNELCVIINQAHPHWSQIVGSEGILNYLRHCVYDAIAEHQARHKKGTIEPDTIKMFKDKYLRIPFELQTPAAKE